MARTIEELDSTGQKSPADYAIVLAVILTLVASAAVFLLR